MKILLQQNNSGHYFKDVGIWTGDPMDAMDFLSSTKAIEFCVLNRVKDVQIVLKFEEQHYDIVLPMATESRYHGGRLASAA